MAQGLAVRLSRRGANRAADAGRFSAKLPAGPLARCAWAAILLGAAAGCREHAQVLPGHPQNPGAKRAKADNSFCMVCHGQYTKDKLAVRHAKAGVGCESCHGPSYAHAGDENNLTPPDVMYARSEVAAACMGCHRESKVRREAAHAKVFRRPEAADRACTGCHGDHRREKRTVRWDKHTGELLPEKKLAAESRS